MKDTIKEVLAYEVLDSRGLPTVACEITTRRGVIGRAQVPSGASTGAHEALELRDGDEDRYLGKGVLTAVENVNTEIAAHIKGLDIADQRSLDEVLIRLDGTMNKSRIGANAILAVSMAVSHAAAKSSGVPLYRQLRDQDQYHLPVPLFNLINGGAHATNGLDVQEFKVAPLSAKTFRDAMEVGSEIFYALKDLVVKRGMNAAVGDEGGFAPSIESSEEALEMIFQAIKNAGYEPGVDAKIDLDVAASEFYKEGKYHFEGETYSTSQMAAVYTGWMKRYPIVSIEDPFDQDAWQSWADFTEAFGREVQIVGDDLLVTNPKKVKEAIVSKACNAVLIKPNQIGTLTETLDVIKMAQEAGLATVMSHRSGETCDTTIADIAVGFETRQIKSGSLARSERLAKYNRIMRIEDELGKNAIFEIPYHS